ncbi:hypothetical protein J4212_04495 [Candidatus Woesearchaeota archaeon]|nr:hypothetical protein [Candidatus Woesearchaeota archaeon]
MGLGELEKRIIIFGKISNNELAEEEDRGKFLFLYVTSDPEEILYSRAFSDTVKAGLWELIRSSGKSLAEQAEQTTPFCVSDKIDSIEELGRHFPSTSILRVKGEFETFRKCEQRLEYELKKRLRPENCEEQLPYEEDKNLAEKLLKYHVIPMVQAKENGDNAKFESLQSDFFKSMPSERYAQQFRKIAFQIQNTRIRGLRDRKVMEYLTWIGAMATYDLETNLATQMKLATWDMSLN